MKRSRLILASTITLAAATAITATLHAAPPPRDVVYVSSQDLFYDTVILGDLPNNGPFQLLVMGANGLETEFGPGDASYLGGRWMEDFDGDGEFHYFLCPLVGPVPPALRRCGT